MSLIDYSFAHFVATGGAKGDNEKKAVARRRVPKWEKLANIAMKSKRTDLQQARKDVVTAEAAKVARVETQAAAAGVLATSDAKAALIRAVPWLLGGAVVLFGAYLYLRKQGG